MQPQPEINAPLSAKAGGGDGLANRNGTRLNNAHQSIIADKVNNEKDINFVSNVSSGSQGAAAGVAHSISANNLNVQGAVNIETNVHYGSQESNIRKWLSSQVPFEFGTKQSENLRTSREAPSTGNWLLKSERFLQWRDGDVRSLWCYGIPGAGKTILASIIIKHLQSEIDDGTTPCLYIYFDYKDQKVQDIKNLLASLLYQLVRGSEQISKELNDLHHAYKVKGMFPTPHDYLRVFKSEAKKRRKVYIVVDALDESEPNTREEFVNTLRQLPDHVHLLFTSRQDQSIRAMVGSDSAELKIVARDDDLREYIETFINNRRDLRNLVHPPDSKRASHSPVKRPTVVGISLLDHVVNKVTFKSKGMFLLARLHMEALALESPATDLESGLAALPQSLDDVYQAALRRIADQGDNKHRLAVSVLMWLVFAERPLTMDELHHAVAVRAGDYATLHLQTQERLTSVCAGLLVMDPETKSVGLAHYTAREYLKKNPPVVFNRDAREYLKKNPPAVFNRDDMAETCLTYLLSQSFSQLPQTTAEIATRKQKYPFYSYAADHWGDHMRASTERGEPQRDSLYRLAERFLFDPEKVMGAFQAMSHYRFAVELNVSALHIAAYFGLERLVLRLIKKNFPIDTMTQRKETALHWAAFYQHHGVVGILVKHNADADICDCDGKTALHKAVMREDVASVQALLKAQRINVDAEDAQLWTPLRWAAAYGNHTLIEILIKQGKAKVDLQDRDAYTALRWAAKNGHRQAIDVLFTHGASPDAPCTDGWTMLTWAATHGQRSWIRSFIDKNIDINAADADGRTPLRLAVEHGHATLAWQLIQANALVNKPDNDGLTPLHIALGESQTAKSKSIAWLLLESKANMDARTKQGLTPLHVAASSGRANIVLLLLEKGVAENRPGSKGSNNTNSGIDVKNKREETPLHLACDGGHRFVVSILLLHKADPRQTDVNNRTALHRAVEAGHAPVAQQLLDHCPELIRARDHEGCTPLHYAAAKGRVDMLELLARRGAKLNAKDLQGNRPLHCAAREKHGQAVAFLAAETTANVNATNWAKRSALHVAAITGDMAVVRKVLAAEGVDTALRDEEGQTAWEILTEQGIKVDQF